MDGKRILFADDDPEIREALRLLLTCEGYETIEASCGKEVLEKIDHTIDLVILDVMMPEMSGYAVCAELRKRYTVPVMFLTAKSQDSDKTLGFSVGGDDYLVKPFSYNELIWNEPYTYSSNNNVTVHIRNIRRKLGDDPQNCHTIRTVWGKGYRIE